MIHPSTLKDRASDRKKHNKILVQRLKKVKPGDLDSVVLDLHHEAFSHIDCLDCANCCKTISPLLIDRDIQRISGFLKMKPSELMEKYLRVDSEGDYVFRQTPCPFLMEDNYCSVYEVRPRACREYPHTDRKRFLQILDLSLKNTFTCPAVFEVFEGLRLRYKK